MEEEIENRLNEIYKIDLSVDFIDFRTYEIKGRIDYKNQIEIIYIYDTRSTLEYNINNIKEKIDKELASIYKK